MKKLIFFLLFTTAMSAQTVYKTPSGKKFHTADCRTVMNSSEALSITDAFSLRLEPCKVCKPSSGQTFTSTKETVSGESKTSVRCKGKTKNGTRCKHMTKIGNGYCFQHQSQQ